MFEAVHTERIGAPPSAIWPLWADPARWPEWNPQVHRAELDGELRVGAEIRVKMRRGDKVRYAVTELEPERLLALEVRFPGARQGHQHRLEPAHQGAEVTHAIRVTGALWTAWSLMLGRKRMREAVAGFTERERELVRPGRQRSRRRSSALAEEQLSRSSSGRARSRSRCRPRGRSRSGA